MANTPSAKKAVRKIERRTAVNRSRRSQMRTYVRKVEEAIAAGDHGCGGRRPACRRAVGHARGAERNRACQYGSAKSLAAQPAGQCAEQMKSCTRQRIVVLQVLASLANAGLFLAIENRRCA